MSEIERSDLSGDVWRFTGGEPVSPDDPIIHGLRWRRERDEARKQLAGAHDALDFAIRTVTDPDLSEAEIRVRIGAVLGRTLAQIGER